MIRVGYIGTVFTEWMGGLNYLRNLLFAINSYENQLIEPIVFMGTKCEENDRKTFQQNAKIVGHRLFDSRSVRSLVGGALQRFAGVQWPLENLVKKHGIDVLSHSDVVKLKSCKTVNWIADFQHLHLPHLFTKAQIEYRNKRYLFLAENSDAIVLSSHSALQDFETVAPQWVDKARVLPFVSQPIPNYRELNQEDEASIRDRYSIRGPFYYLPNQFWAHKNHRVVFEAVRILKSRGETIRLVCSGQLEDYRNHDHIDGLRDFIGNNKLQENILLLGIVPYEDVFALMKYSIAVVNPSLFEGWSSTVEECKSVGKPMILSDLSVHKEQYPEAIYFDRGNPEMLADILEKDASDFINDNSEKSSEMLRRRTNEFAENYRKIVSGCLD
jgi:glycosyltransferase involved in cell wall biosynthesis